LPELSILTFYGLQNLKVIINLQQQRQTELNSLLNNVLSEAR